MLELLSESSVSRLLDLLDLLILRYFNLDSFSPSNNVPTFLNGYYLSFVEKPKIYTNNTMQLVKVYMYPANHFHSISFPWIDMIMVIITRNRMRTRLKSEDIQYKHLNCIFFIEMWFSHYSYLPTAFANLCPLIICRRIAQSISTAPKP